MKSKPDSAPDDKKVVPLHPPSKYYYSPDGTPYRFDRKAEQDKDGLVSLSQLSDDEIVIAPGFIYVRMP